MRLKFSYAATIAAILMFSQAAIAGELFPKVLVSVAPLKPYVDEILKGHGAATNLLRPGQDPHSFALAPSQAQALDQADILIVPDLGMNPFLKRLAATKKHLRIIELSKLDGADPLPYAEENPWLRKAKAAHAPTERDKKKTAAPEAETPHPEKGLNDPHFWLDPERMAAIAVPLANAIAEASPEAGPTLSANATALAVHLRQEVLPPLREMLSAKPRLTNAMQQPEVPFITYHAAYQYFLGRFQLIHMGEITARPEEMIGAKRLSSLFATAEKTRVRCIIGESNNVLMSRIAKQTGARIILLSPEQIVARSGVDALDWIKTDYDALLYKTAKSFAGCL